jgi:hypothetical protein
MTTEKETLQRVTGGLYHLQRGLTPFVEARMKARHGADWLHHARRAEGSSGAALDEYGLLQTMLGNWREVFDEAFGRNEKHRVRDFTSTALAARHAAYHREKPIKDNEALRYLDAMLELLAAVKAPQEEVAELKRLYDEQRRSGLSTPDRDRPEPLPPPPPPVENMNPAEARRRVNQRCKLAVLDRNNTHFANIGQARPDIWWLNIPLKKVEGPQAKEIIHLLLYNDLSDQLYHLRVPTSYFRENLGKLSRLREQIDLYLSTDNSTLFQDKHDSKCPFQHFVCGCSG